MESLTYSLVIVMLIVMIIYQAWQSSIYELMVIQPVKSCSKKDGRCYTVSSVYDNTEGAADIFARINKDMLTVIRYMRNNYLWNPRYTNSKDPAILLRKILVSHMLSRYSAESLAENIPKSLKSTSYTDDKGKKVALCLREKHSGSNQLEQYERVLFVGLHELAHISTNIRDHEEPFWYIFKVLLIEAHKSGVYNPIDYEKVPIDVCGLKVEYNPYFDTSLNESYLYGMLGRI